MSHETVGMINESLNTVLAILWVLLVWQKPGGGEPPQAL